RGVTVLGVTPAFFGSPEVLAGEGVWLNAALARVLNVAAGDTITLRLQKPSEVPRGSVRGRKDQTVDEWELTVARVLAENDPEDHFSLRPGLETPRNAFVPLGLLQQRLEQPGRANALLVAGPSADLPELLRARLTLDD